MLVFIDESGHPHPNDPSTRPVLSAVCFAERDSRSINRQLFRTKRLLLGDERTGLELKAHDLLKRSTFRRKPELRELVESVFDLIRNFPITIFAVTMERPAQALPRQTIHLPRQYRYILQRVNTLLLDETAMAVIFGGWGMAVNMVDCPENLSGTFTDMVKGNRWSMWLTRLIS